MGNKQIDRMNDPSVQADHIDTSGGNDSDITSSLRTRRKLNIFGHGNAQLIRAGELHKPES